jgi:hypothetical protein
MRRLSPLCLLLGAPGVLLPAAAARADEAAGEKVYRKLCISCHGPGGEGTKDNPEPLVGDRSVANLAKYIEKRMPKDAPGKCAGDDARNVAEYIHGAFYSLAAQARNKPPRIELSRLTVSQYRNAVADLLETFAEAGKWDDRRGLRAEYFNAGRRIREDRRVLERVDRRIDFSFGASSPAERVAADEFAIRWTGGVLAPETGEYEIVVETENGARLWLNDGSRPLIDATVRSGDQRKYRESAPLLGGRVHPLRLEYFKSKADKSASVRLLWKRPHRVEEPVPEDFLSPGRTPEVMVVRTPFPPDDRSMGYERSTSISKAWDEAATSAALEVAAIAASRLEAWIGRRPDAPDAKPRLRDLGRRFAERAFRRPLSAEEQAFFVDRPLDSGPDPVTAFKKLAILVLKSPRFLYHGLDPAGGDAYDVAARISFGLWDSLPDAELLEAARAGRLGSAEEIARQVERMMPDLRTRSKVREFFHRWLQLDRIHELSKDSKRFPEFTEAVASDLKTSLELFLEDVTWSDASDVRQLLLAETVFLNGRLARLYGGDLPPDAPFQKVVPGPKRHSGILTHPLLMAGFAYDSTSSPIHRGLFVARSLLGKRLRPPQDAVTPLSPELHPDLTTRERIALQTRPQTCQSCHSMINPLGFAFEHYDALGRFRGDEKGKPIDASGSYVEVDGDAVRFAGARELGEYLAKSEETEAAVVEHVFQYFVKQPVRAYGLDRPEILRREFVKNGHSLRKLLVQVITASASAGGRVLKEKSP